MKHTTHKFILLRPSHDKLRWGFAGTTVLLHRPRLRGVNNFTGGFNYA